MLDTPMFYYYSNNRQHNEQYSILIHKSEELAISNAILFLDDGE